MCQFRDTVDAVGVISRSLPFTTSNTIIRTFRHALALDEHRAKFRANLWHRTPSRSDQRFAVARAPVRERHWYESTSGITKESAAHWTEEELGPDTKALRQEVEMPSMSGQVKSTDIEEVWFPVCLVYCTYWVEFLIAFFRDVTVVLLDTPPNFLFAL